jgi:predicted RNase H-like HicB family nuclease
VDIQIEPKEALTGFLDLPNIGRLRLDFLITYESDAYYIRCLDFGIMSCGDSIEECKEDIKEAIEIYLEDIPEGQSIYDPSPIEYWRMFYELRYQKEQEKMENYPQDKDFVIEESLRKTKNLVLQYA